MRTERDSGGFTATIASAIEDNKKTFYKGLLVVIILCVAVGMRIHQNRASAVTVKESSPSQRQRDAQAFYVDVSGAVNTPGVYKASKKTRIFQIIEKAGGLTEDADLDAVNQAAYVKDGEKIVIPSRAPEGERAGEETAAAAGISSDGKVNINQATKDELMTLHGIGEVMAGRIIEHRTSSRFQSVEDLKSVKGIGEVTYSNLKDDITV